MFFSIPFQENDFACGRTCIFGLDADEHEALKTVGEVAPRVFTEGDVIHTCCCMKDLEEDFTD